MLWRPEWFRQYRDRREPDGPLRQSGRPHPLLTGVRNTDPRAGRQLLCVPPTRVLLGTRVPQSRRGSLREPSKTPVTSLTFSARKTLPSASVYRRSTLPLEEREHCSSGHFKDKGEERSSKVCVYFSAGWRSPGG